VNDVQDRAAQLCEACRVVQSAGSGLRAIRSHHDDVIHLTTFYTIERRDAEPWPGTLGRPPDLARADATRIEIREVGAGHHFVYPSRYRDDGVRVAHFAEGDRL